MMAVGKEITLARKRSRSRAVLGRDRAADTVPSRAYTCTLVTVISPNYMEIPA